MGERVPRIDVQEKVLGTGKYPDDLEVEGMIYGSALRAAYPRARVLAIHTEEAKALPGVIDVYTAEDVPGNVKTGHLKKDSITPEKLSQIQQLNDIARQRNQTLAQMSISWLLRNETVTSVLIGASSPQQLKDNLKAQENIGFSDEELSAIDKILK